MQRHHALEAVNAGYGRLHAASSRRRSDEGGHSRSAISSSPGSAMPATDGNMAPHQFELHPPVCLPTARLLRAAVKTATPAVIVLTAEP